MRGSLILIFLLLLPGMEVYTLFRFFESAPWLALAYLCAAGAVGWLLMRVAKVGVAETVRRLVEQRGRPAALLIFGKMWAVGALLFFPGYITDCLALALLLLPGGIFSGGKNRGGGESENGSGEKRRRVVEVEGRVERVGSDDRA